MRILATTEGLEIARLIIAAITPLLGAATLWLLRTVHGIVNSNMTEQKRLTAMFAERLAEVSPNQKDIILASEAKRIYEASVPKEK